MMGQFRYKALNGIRALRRWVVPYILSELHPDKFHPVLCYLFTDWKCNVDCHYCFQNDNARPGMSWETAKSSIDWLKAIGCRVLSIMGGEPLIRKKFILDVIRYGSENGFFVYLPTNGQLMDERFIDEMGEAGLAALNLAVDCVEPKPGLPKAFSKIEPQFRYLVKQQEKYGYLVFLNINICRNNIEDARRLTEIAHEYRIGTDYHLNEAPHDFVRTDHYKHKEDSLYILPEQYDQVDQLLDWLIEKQQRDRWPMVNPVAHLETLKKRMRGTIPAWDCRAGQSGFLIRPDGSLAPCFDMITYDHDWGHIWRPRFDPEELKALKAKCLPNCSSTCFYTLGHYYNPRYIPEWVRKHARVG